MSKSHLTRFVFLPGTCAAFLGGVAFVTVIGFSQPASAQAGFECEEEDSDTAEGATAVVGSSDRGDTACGGDANADSTGGAAANYATAFGDDADAIGDGTSAFGDDANATGVGATAIGGDAGPGDTGAQATANFSTAIGAESDVFAVGGTALGFDADVAATATEGTAVGSGTNVDPGATQGIAVGHTATVDNDAAYSIAIGADSDANGVGAWVQPGSTHAIAIGDEATIVGADSDGAIAIGGNINGDAFGTEVRGTAAVGLGGDARANGDGAIAIGGDADGNGLGARALSTNAIAIGDDAMASHANSMALGSGATTSRPNQMVVGTGSNTYTMPGITSPASRAAQSGPLELVTTDSAGNLASDGGDTFRRVNENTEGVAMALALQTPWVPPTQQFALSGGFGLFEGKEAASLGGAFRLDPNIQFEAGIGIGIQHGTLGGRVGVTVSW